MSKKVLQKIIVPDIIDSAEDGALFYFGDLFMVRRASLAHHWMERVRPAEG